MCRVHSSNPICPLFCAESTKRAQCFMWSDEGSDGENVALRRRGRSGPYAMLVAGSMKHVASVADC